MSEVFSYNRRKFVAALFASALIPSNSFALASSDATKIVDRVVTEINKIIDSGESEAKMLNEFEAVFGRYADVPTIARYALGRDGRSASAEQMERFIDAFSVYMSRKYGRRFREFIGGRIEVKTARKTKNYYEVRTMAHMSGFAPFEVDFLVSDRSGKPLIFNMIIEGVNMLLAERQEIGAILDQNSGNIDRLINTLRAYA